jgi:hypothetical protein
LLIELGVLAMAEFFLASFYRRANAFKINIPIGKFFFFVLQITSKIRLELKWNARGAFVGEITQPEVEDPPVADSEQDEVSLIDERSMLYKHFLATPFIKCLPGVVERKFSGTDDVGHNDDVMGRVVDAYAHHVVVDSHGEYLIVDIQGTHMWPSVLESMARITF